MTSEQRTAPDVASKGPVVLTWTRGDPSTIAEHAWSDGSAAGTTHVPRLPGVAGGPMAPSPLGSWLLTPRYIGGSVVEYLVDLSRQRAVALDGDSHYLWSGDGRTLCGTRSLAQSAPTTVFVLDPATLHESQVGLLPALSTVNFYGLLGCEPSAGRLVVAAFGFGDPVLPVVTVMVLTVDGRILRRTDYAADQGQLFVSVAPDCSVFAENWLSPLRTTTVRLVDSAAVLETVPLRHVITFSWGGALLVTDAATGNGSGFDVRTADGRVVWTNGGTLAASETGPSPGELAVEAGSAQASSAYLILRGGARVNVFSGATLHLPNQ